MEHNQQPTQTKLCPVCGAKNKSAYRYCNECGAAFIEPTMAPQPTFTGSYAPPTAPYTPAPAPTVTEDMTFDGVTAADLFTYTGKNSDLYQKILMRRLSPGSRAFCVPLLVLGLLFGFFGMACWYIYHKMYKPATLFLILTAAFLGANLLASIDGMNALACWFGDMINQIQNGDLLNGMTEDQFIRSLYGSMFDALNTESGPITTVANLLTNVGSIAQIVLAIVLPFHAYNRYLNTAIIRIQKAYQKSDSPNIARIGGTNGGLLALIIVLYVIATLVITFVMLAPLMETMIQTFQELGPALDDSFTTY